MHNHTHTYKSISTYIFMLIHKHQTHTNIFTHIDTYTHFQTKIRTHTITYIHTHANIDTVKKDIYTQIHTHSHRHRNIFINTNAHTE